MAAIVCMYFIVENIVGDLLLLLLVSGRGKGREESCGFSGKVRAEDKSATGAGGDGKLLCWLIERDRTEFSSFS